MNKQEKISKIYEVIVETDKIEICWMKVNPVMIWDVLDWWNNFELWEEIFCKVAQPNWYNNVSWFDTYFWKLMNLWEFKRKPIEEQDDECIEYIYNLIK